MRQELFREPTRDEKGWVKEYEGRGAYFEHDGNAKRPHPLLRSNKHSKGFFNSRPLIADEKLMREVTRDIVSKLLETEGFDIEAVNRVVGPKTGATRLSEFVAAEIGARRGRPCGWASPKKLTDADGNTTGMEFDDPDHTILPGERVLFVEDVMTTGGSMKHVINAVFALGGIALTFIGMMVNRSGETSVLGMAMVALVTRHLPNYDVPDGKPCPLCDAGSEAVEAKANWTRLTAQY
jgi:orotate phosphoribosyltransferase